MKEGNYKPNRQFSDHEKLLLKITRSSSSINAAQGSALPLLRGRLPARVTLLSKLSISDISVRTILSETVKPSASA
jgi:hypothetical protein